MVDALLHRSTPRRRNDLDGKYVVGKKSAA